MTASWVLEQPNMHAVQGGAGRRLYLLTEAVDPMRQAGAGQPHVDAVGCLPIDVLQRMRCVCWDGANLAFVQVAWA